MIERLVLQDDGPDGMTLVIEDTELARDRSTVLRIEHDTLLEFLRSKEVAGFLEHVAEGERQYEAYKRATPEERAEVLTGEQYGTPEELEAELYREKADIDRKRQKGE